MSAGSTGAKGDTGTSGSKGDTGTAGAKGDTGSVTFASSAEVNTGTESAKAVNPDALAGANLGIRICEIHVFDFATDWATGDGKSYFVVPSALNGMNLVYCHARAITAGTTNT
jgi:hypothetical protein